MKRFFLVLVLGFVVGSVWAVQPVRKPFIQLTVDGNPIKNGEAIIVTQGQKLIVGAELEGGRRDYCKFPDIYTDIAGSAQILSRGADGLVYQLNGTKAEWKLLKETIRFTGDDFVRVSSDPQKQTAEVVISNTTFSQSFLKVSINAKWQFSQNNQTSDEENVAEATLYFKMAGTSDVWFSTHDVHASGMKNELVQEKLNAVQAGCDSIENNFYKLKFPAVQQAIRNLQSAVNNVKITIDEVKTSNPAYQTNIVFIGLPSDNSYSNLGIFTLAKTHWGSLEPLVQSLKQQLGALPAKSSNENKNELNKLIGAYADWQSKLPENALKITPLYIPDFKPEDILLPENLQFTGKEKAISNYEQALSDFNSFLDKRIEQVPIETQKINSTQSRLQAVRLFDGMLRSYYSSINWAEWKNTRE